MQDRQKNRRGATAIEMAILLPILLLIVMAVIEFGIYFVKYQIATRAVANITDTIQKKPSEATPTLARQEGLSLIDLTHAPNYFCAKSYKTNAEANNGKCTMGEWDTSAPAGTAESAAYYVAVRAYSPHTPITPFTMLSKTFPPPIDVPAVVMVNPVPDIEHGIEVLTFGSGTQWQVPEGFTRIKATIIGGGGAATGGWNSGGGGAGAVAIVFFKDLVPGSYISYSIGAGGGIPTQSSSQPPVDGGNTTFNNIVVGGGKGSNNGGISGAGGTIAPNQVPALGRISSAAYFNGTPGNSYNGGGANSGYSNYGMGGGPLIGGAHGAVILEW